MITNFKKYIKGGKVITKDELCDNLHIRSIREFLNNLFLDFAAKSYRFYKNTDDLPFIYSEKQLHSILCPSLYDNSDSLFSEQPINRSKGSNEKSGRQKRKYGWTDYLAVKEERAYLIEVKHSWQAADKVIVTETTQNRWNKAKDQLNIPHNQLKDIYSPSKIYVALNIMVLPVYSCNSKESNCSLLSSDDTVTQWDNVIKSLLPKPNWAGLWIFNNNLKQPFKYLDGYQAYSSLMFLVHCRLIK